jgi:hypothetical protein
MSIKGAAAAISRVVYSLRRILGMNVETEPQLPPWLSEWAEIETSAEKRIAADNNETLRIYLRAAVGLVNHYALKVGSATKNQALLPHLQTMPAHVIDAARGVVAGYEHRSAVTMSAVARVIFEVRCTLATVSKHPTPIVMAQRYADYSAVDQLQHEERQPLDERLPAPQLSELEKKARPWKKPNGKWNYNWTLDPNLDSVRKCATVASLDGEYELLYPMTSVFMHGSPLLKNTYARGPIAPVQTCEHIAVLGAVGATSFIEEFCEFFGIAVEKIDFMNVNAGLLKASGYDAMAAVQEELARQKDQASPEPVPP